MSNEPSSGDFPCSQAASAWRRRKPSAPARIWTRRTSWTCCHASWTSPWSLPATARAVGHGTGSSRPSVEYAGERLSEAGESPGIQRRHAEYYLRLAEAGGRCAARRGAIRVAAAPGPGTRQLPGRARVGPGRRSGTRAAPRGRSRRLLVHSRRGEGRKGLARPVPGSVCRRHTVSREGHERRRAPRLRPGRDRGRPSTTAAEHPALGDRAGPAQPRDGTELPGTAGSGRFHRVRGSRRESTSRERSPSPASSETDSAKDSPSGISATTSTTAPATSFAAPSCSSDRWTFSSRWVTA